MPKTTELWSTVVGYEGFYEVSSLGRVRRIAPGPGTRPGRIRKLVPRNGYYQVILSKNNVVQLCWVHRLVAKAFLPEDSQRPEVNHKDGNRANNCIDNLEWCSHGENALHSYRFLGRKSVPTVGSKNRNAVLNEADIPVIREAAKTETLRSIAKRYGVSFGLIGHIIHGRAWNHVP